MGNGHLWGAGQSVNDDAGAWAWMRLHGVYAAAVVAILVATLLGAHWAGQPSPEVRTTSSSPSVIVDAPLPPVE